MSMAMKLSSYTLLLLGVPFSGTLLLREICGRRFFIRYEFTVKKDRPPNHLKGIIAEEFDFDPPGRKRGKEMSFIMEFAENLILWMMEDPKERDRKFREHIYSVKDRCKKTKEMWSYPLRPYGFWTFERHNAQLFWDPQISQAPGRRDPYDDLLQEGFETPK